MEKEKLRAYNNSRIQQLEAAAVLMHSKILSLSHPVKVSKLPFLAEAIYNNSRIQQLGAAAVLAHYRME